MHSYHTLSVDLYDLISWFQFVHILTCCLQDPKKINSKLLFIQSSKE